MRKTCLRLLAVLGPLVLAAPLAQALTADPAGAATASGGIAIARGTVRSTAGDLVAGAVVDLYAWPSDKTLDALTPGEVVPRKLIATARTSASGSFALSAPARALADTAVSGSYANLEVDSGGSSWFITDPVTNWTAATVHLTDVTGAVAPDTCVDIFQRQLHRQLGTVGQVYDWGNAPGVDQAFTYSGGQSTTLSIGISQSGKAGSFSADGSETQSAGFDLHFPTQKRTGFYHFRTPWRVAKYLRKCTLTNRRGASLQKHIVRVNDWVGVANITRASKAPKATICGLQPKGASISTHRERASTVGAGLTVAEVGFNVSMQTGYDSSAQITLTFNKARHMCGTGGLSAPKAGIIVIKK